MRHLAATAIRLIWFAGACLLLLSRAAAAGEPALSADFDADGLHDRVTLDSSRSTVVHVWLSASGRTQVIHTRAPLQRLIAADLDGDRRPELIARDSESRIHVWTHTRAKLKSYRPRKVEPRTLKLPARRNIDDQGPEPGGVTTTPAFTPLALRLCASPRAPARAASKVGTRRAVRAYRSFSAIDPFVPRPPPAPLSF